MSWLNILAFFDQLEFITLWVFALLPLPLIIRLLIKPALKQEASLLAPQIVGRLGIKNNFILQPNAKQHFIPMIYMLLWLLVLLAASRPALFIKPTSFDATGRDMILAVDLSGSMEKDDMRLNGQRVNRLVAVKAVVEDFIEQRQGDRLGLVVFGTQAFIQSPLTHDLTTVNQLLQETEIGMAGNNTAIGDAIGLTLKHLANTEQEQTVLILLTDGSNTDGVVSPLDAAEQARKFGLKIYTIGIGQQRSPSILDSFLSSGYGMDIETLKNIADITGGEFFLASDTKRLNEIYAHINLLEKTTHQIHQFRLRTELYQYPLGLALILSLLIAVTRLRAKA